MKTDQLRTALQQVEALIVTLDGMDGNALVARRVDAMMDIGNEMRRILLRSLAAAERQQLASIHTHSPSFTLPPLATPPAPGAEDASP